MGNHLGKGRHLEPKNFNKELMLGEFFFKF